MTGLFIAFFIVCKNIDNGEPIDIFNVVKKIRQCRPEFITAVSVEIDRKLEDVRKLIIIFFFFFALYSQGTICAFIQTRIRIYKDERFIWTLVARQTKEMEEKKFFYY